jgi:hypothetical protein
MTDAEALEKECRALCGRFGVADPPPYVVRKYLEAHEPGRCGPGTGDGTPDETLLALARRGGAWLALADAHAAVFRRGGALRRKMILALAILESYGPTSARVDSPAPGTALALLAGIGLRCAAFLLAASASLLVVPCWRAARAFRGGSSARGPGASR